MIVPLSDGELHIPATALLNRDVPPEFTENGLMAVNFGGFLIRTDDDVVVVDTGVGGDALPELGIGSLPDRLRAAGVAPEDVDTVIFTHLHFDHVGWSGLFTAARFHAHAIDWAYWVTDATPESGPGREDFGAIPAPERLAPIADRVTLHGGERTEIVPGVTLRLAPGHSPGHCIVEAGDIVLLADAAHNPAQLLADDYESVTDEDPELARRTRAALAAELAGSGRLIAMTHHPRAGRLDDRRRWTYAPSIE